MTYVKGLKSIVEYNEYKVPNGATLEIKPFIKGDENRWWRTLTNLDKMMKDGRPVTLVSPVRPLTEEDLEDYRKYFCAEAKSRKCNFVYLDVPFEVRILEE